MKKSLLTLFVAVTAALSANAQNLLKNEGFETWENTTTPTYWKTASTAGSATLAQSNEAKSGTYAVAISGVNATTNKRLGYNEITLKKGTYTFSVNAKSAFADAKTKCGYVKVTADNKIANSKTDYVYAKDYVNGLSDWKTASFEFTLAEDTRLSLLVMIAKADKDYTLLIDDASLTTADGGIVEGTVTPDPTPQPQPQPNPTPETGVIFFDELKDNATQWTLDNSNLPEGLSFVWKHDTKYFCLKGTGYYKKAYAATAYAISPVIQLTTNNTLSFDHAGGYYNAENPLKNNCSVLIREEGGEWKALEVANWPVGDGNKFEFMSSGDISLSAYNGKKVQIGFKYTSTDALAGTWEFKNFKVAGTPNSINAIAKAQGEDVIFDLSGRRVKKAENGIFIINGVKQLVK